MANNDQPTDITAKNPEEIGMGTIQQNQGQNGEIIGSDQPTELSGESSEITGSEVGASDIETGTVDAPLGGQGTEIQGDIMGMLISSVGTAFGAMGLESPSEEQIKEGAANLSEADKKAINAKGQAKEEGAAGAEGGGENDTEASETEGQQKEQGAFENLIRGMGPAGMIAALAMVVMAQFNKGGVQENAGQSESVESEVEQAPEELSTEEEPAINPDEQAIENQQMENTAETQNQGMMGTRTDGLLVPDKVPAPDDLEPHDFSGGSEIDPDAELGAGDSSAPESLDGVDLSAMEPDLSESISGFEAAAGDVTYATADANVVDSGNRAPGEGAAPGHTPNQDGPPVPTPG